MKNKLLAAILGSLMLLSFAPASAQPMSPAEKQAGRQYQIKSRIDKQERDIRHGIRAGVITRGEAAILRDNLAHIKHEFNRVRRDGYVDRAERDRLNGMLDRNHRMIKRMEHNGVTRYDRW